MAQLPIPPGYQALEDEIVERLKQTSAPKTSLPQPIMPPPASPIPITPVAQNIDDSALKRAIAETTGGGLGGSIRSLGNAMYDTVTNPSSIGPAALEFGKGAASGATLGLSELIPGMTPDPESWAGTAGNLAGFAVPGVGAAKGVAAGARFLPGALKGIAGSTLGSNVISGGLLGPLDAKIRSSVEGSSEEPNLALAAAGGAVIPVAAHGVGKLVGAGLRRFFGSAAPEVAAATPAQGINPIKVLAPDLQAEYQKFIRTPDVPPTSGPQTGGSSIPVPGRTPADYPAYLNEKIAGLSNPAWDTVPLGGFLTPGSTAYTPEGLPVTISKLRGPIAEYVGNSNIRGEAPTIRLRPELPKRVVTHGGHVSDIVGQDQASGDIWIHNAQGELQKVPLMSTRPAPASDIELSRGGASVPPGTLHGPPPPIESSRPPGSGGPGVPPTQPPTTTGGGNAAAPIGPNGEQPPPSLWDEGSRIARGLLRKFNLPIRELGRNPETRPLMDSLLNFSDRGQFLETGMQRQVDNALKGWTSEMEKFYYRARLEFQGKPGIEGRLAQFPGSPAQVQTLTTGHQLLHDAEEGWRRMWVDRGFIAPEAQIENHLPWMRYKAITPGEVKVEIDNAPRTVGYMNSWMQEHPRARSSMMKTRNLEHEDIPQAMLYGPSGKERTLREMLAIKMKGIARPIAFHDEVVLGGRGPGGITGQLQNGKPTYWVDGALNGIQDPGLKQYAIGMVNHAAGVPKTEGALGGLIDNSTAARYAAWTRRLQFNHLIAGQFLTPLVNLTQSMITLTQVSTSNWGKAWKLVAQNTPHEGFKDLQSGIAMIPRDFAEKWVGASGTFNKADEGLIQSGLWGKIAMKVSEPFRWSERTNQRHAAIAGYLEANSRKLEGQEAVNFAKNINRYTQQFGGIVNTPEVFQGPIGSMVGQFKSYPIGFMGIMKDLFTRAGVGANMALTGEASRINPITNQSETALQHMKPLIKFLAATGALGGPAAFVNAFGEDHAQQIVNYINDQTALNLPDWTKAGLLGYLGVDLSNQIGFGSLPLSTNLKDMMWFLPGPALSNVADGLTVASYLFDSAGVNPLFSPKAGPRRGLALDFQHAFGGDAMGGISPDDMLSRSIRAFAPVGGPQLDKFHKFYKNQQTGNDEVEALNLLQALGAEVPSGDLIRRSPEQAPIDQHLGLPEEIGRARSIVFNPLGRAEEIQHRAHLVEEGKEDTSALRTYHTLVAGGQTEEARRFAEQHYARTGRPLIPSERALEEAYNRRAFPATVRMEQRAAWPMQVYERMNR